MVLIEVQTGSYFGEDDIIRYEDAYARGQGVKHGRPGDGKAAGSERQSETEPVHLFADKRQDFPRPHIEGMVFHHPVGKCLAPL